MSNIRVLVVEDEVIIADDIANALSDYGYEVLEPANTYTEALDSIEKNRPDIAILDIQLQGIKSGVDIATIINEKYNFPFIFLTSNSDKITLEQAKKVEPLAYLIKPFNKKELFTSIEVALYNYSKHREKALNEENLIIKNALFIKSNKAFIRLDFKDILYLASDHIYIEVYTANGKKHIVRGSLNDYASKLGKSFFRAHRSVVVNLDYLQEFSYEVLLTNGTKLPLGKKQREELLERINKG